MNKQDFPILKENLIYLDNSSTTQKPGVVIKALKEFYENYNSNVHRGIHNLSQQATLAYEDARQTVANFIGADYNEIIFTSGTTDSLNYIAKSLTNNFLDGDEIILTDMEHHSNIIPWQEIAKEKKLVIKFIPITKDYKLDLQKAEELITEKTKIVSITHISNVLGTINPVKEVTKLSHKVGAKVILDAAQSVPHMPVDVKDLDCDFLAFSGHKMCGPTGIGVLYGKKELLQKLEPAKFGGGMIKEVHFHKSTWADIPEKFEAGTPNIAGAIGLATAVKYLQKIGLDKIQKHCQEITEYALDNFSKIPNLQLFGSGNKMGRIPIFSFNIENIHPHDLSESLDRVNIAVRAGNHCAMPLMNKFGVNSTTRASFYFYNTKEDVDFLVLALQELIDPTNKNEIVYGDLTEEQEIFKENILDHYKNPHNKGIIENAEFEQLEFNKICGDKIRIFLNTENNKVTEIKWCGEGCVISQAAVSLLSDELSGKDLEQVKKIDDHLILELLGIPISYTRIKCALLPLKTLQGALK
jgi:cysteine desulfurase / selenocysteine lyase